MVKRIANKSKQAGEGIIRTAAYSKKAAKTITLSQQLTREEYKQHILDNKNREYEFKTEKKRLRKINIQDIYTILKLAQADDERPLFQKLIEIGWIHDLTEYECPKCKSVILL